MFEIAVRPLKVSHTACWGCLLAILLLNAGCADNLTNRHSKSREQTARPPFQLTIQPVEGQSQKVLVVVTATEETAWSSSTDGKPLSWHEVLSLHWISEAGDGQSRVTEEVPKRPSQSPMSCRYSIVGNQLRLEPAFPLLAGQRYLAHFDSSSLKQHEKAKATVLQSEYTVPAAPTGEKPRLLAIYPRSDTLPANHLKFYLVFSEPMSRGDVFRSLRLENITTGTEVPDPFRNTELWSQDDRQLTLWFHPGRQKDGVNLNVDLGPILEEGNQYRLVIRNDMQSKSGNPLSQAYDKQFRAGPLIRTQIDYRSWTIAPPKVDTKEPLVCRFGRPLDWALLRSEICIKTAKGKVTAGRIVISDNETTWRFHPHQPWEKGAYRLAISCIVEDLAGNSIQRPFAVDLSSAPAKPIAPVVYRDFKIGLNRSRKSP